jgi:hypothetical protein
MTIVSLLLALLLQAPPALQPVVVGLDDGNRVAFDSPDFSGFIEGRGGDAVLLYHEKKFHGEMPVKTISRIDFGPYKKGKAFQLKVTLRSGDELNVESERRDFLTIRGKTELGLVTIKHPDPLSTPVKLTTGKPNRKKSLTIQYLEFPPS